MNAGDNHERVDQLLPWYANGSLDAATRHMIATHLGNCERCREELDFLGDVRKVMRHSVAAESSPARKAGGFESLPAELRQRVRESAAMKPHARSRRLLIPALAASLFAAIALGVALTVTQLEEPRFRTATSPAALSSEHVRVVIRFAPEAEFGRVNELLREHRAVIVQGPDEHDHWLLEVPVVDETHRIELLDRLRGAAGIEQAELARTQSNYE